MTKNARFRASFRSSSKWKSWRKHLKARKVDELTQKPLRAGWQAHHLDLDIEHYTELREEVFSTLNRNSHFIVHEMYRYYCKDKGIIERLRVILDRMCEINRKKEEQLKLFGEES